MHSRPTVQTLGGLAQSVLHSKGQLHQDTCVWTDQLNCGNLLAKPAPRFCSFVRRNVQDAKLQRQAFPNSSANWCQQDLKSAREDNTVAPLRHCPRAVKSKRLRADVVDLWHKSRCKVPYPTDLGSLRVEPVWALDHRTTSRVAPKPLSSALCPQLKLTMPKMQIGCKMVWPRFLQLELRLASGYFVRKEQPFDRVGSSKLERPFEPFAGHVVPTTCSSGMSMSRISGACANFMLCSQ